MTHLQLLKKTAAEAAEKKAAAKKAAAEAKARRERAEALRGEAEEIRRVLAEVRALGAFLSEEGKAAVKAAEARLAEIEAHEDYRVLMAEIEARAEAEAKAQMEAEMNRLQAEAEARKRAKAKARAKAERLVARWEDAQRLFRWVRGTGPNRLGVALGGGAVPVADLRKAFQVLGIKTPKALKATKAKGLYLPQAAVRLERIERNGRELVAVSSARGDAVSLGKGPWLLSWPCVPAALRRALVKAGWLQEPARKEGKPSK
jgi:hypothetical protein